MNYHRVWYVVLTFALGLLTLSSVAAAPPQFFVFEIDETRTFGRCDGFKIIEQVTGIMKIVRRDTEDEGFINVVQHRLRVTYTNLATGESVSTPHVGLGKVLANIDGIHTFIDAGLRSRIVVPGEGLIVANAGRIVIVITGPDEGDERIDFQAGPQGELLPALCTVLAS